MAAVPDAPVPGEILEWLGIENYSEKNYAAAEKYLSALGKSRRRGDTDSTRGEIDTPSNVKPDFWFYLGDAAAKLQSFDESEDAFGKYLHIATDPAATAKGLLSLGC